jgi:hypothetical protein
MESPAFFLIFSMKGMAVELSPAFPPCASSSLKRIVPPPLPPSAPSFEYVPEECHARRTSVGPMSGSFTRASEMAARISGIEVADAAGAGRGSTAEAAIDGTTATKARRDGSEIQDAEVMRSSTRQQLATIIREFSRGREGGRWEVIHLRAPDLACVHATARALRLPEEEVQGRARARALRHLRERSPRARPGGGAEDARVPTAFAFALAKLPPDMNRLILEFKLGVVVQR